MIRRLVRIVTVAVWFLFAQVIRLLQCLLILITIGEHVISVKVVASNDPRRQGRACLAPPQGPLHRGRGRVCGRRCLPQDVRLGGFVAGYYGCERLAGSAKAAQVIVIGVDPGLDTGVAAVKDGVLDFAGLVDPRYMSYHISSRVFIECPRIYPTGTPNPNDLIKLAVMVGRYVEYFDSHNTKVALIAPSDWKGQQPKVVTERRMRARFPDLDRWLVGIPKSKAHNVIDSIGIAAYGWDKEQRK